MTRLMIFAAALLSGCAATVAKDPVVAAPDIPDTDIFVGELSFDSGAPSVDGLHNATSRKGYDNQPFFLAGEAAFYYVAEGESGKTDIRLYDIGRGASQPVFISADRSEYSPRQAPSGGLSYIQENPQGDVTQVYRRAPGETQGAAVVDFAPLGYYAWLDGGKALGVYYRSEPGSLYRVDVNSGATTLVHDKIGRALFSDRNGATMWFTEIRGESDPVFRLMGYDSRSGGVASLFDLPPGAQDFAIVFDEAGDAATILSAEGATLYWRHMNDADGAWRKVADFSGMKNMSRLAVSDDRKWVALVAEPAE